MAPALTETQLRSWMQRLGPKLIAISTSICRDRHRAEEIVQEAFVKLWNRPPDAGEIAYSSWLRRVVTNLSINALQRTKRHGQLPEFSNDPAMHSGRRTEERRDASERLARVQEAMHRLDDKKRAILMLRASEGLAYDEIAQHMGIPVGTVMSRLNRARTALMDELQKMETEGSAEPEVFEFRKYKSG